MAYILNKNGSFPRGEITQMNNLTNTDPNTIRIFVVRHGQTNHNVKKILQGHLDTELNEEGVKQAKLVGDRLKDLPFDAAKCSDLKRCQQTINEIIKYHPEVKVHTTENLRERFMGIAEGMRLSDALKMAETTGKDYKEYGESRSELVARLYREWDYIIDEGTSHQNFLICTHGGVITNFLNHLYSDLHYELSENVTPDSLKVPFNTSITVVDVNKLSKQGIIQCFGDTAHLGRQLDVKDQLLR